MRPGDRLGRYRFIEEIGAGGMGVVFRARDERLERDVAVKVLPAGALVDQTSHRRFRQEALALSRLNHPHIAAVYDFETVEGTDLLVMEYVQGRTLSEVLANGALSEKDVALLGAQIAEALQEAHEHGIIHRDLKPGNVILTSRGTVKVLDFGLAKMLQVEGDESRTSDALSEPRAVMGTLPYMSPEQLLGEPVDAESDIYSAGALLYEMATGRRPFPESPAARLVDAILNRDPVPPSSLNGSLSRGLETIVLKALDKQPRRRYPSARDLALELTRLSTSFPALPAARRPAIGRRLIPAAAVVLLAALLAGLHFTGVFGSLIEALRDQTVPGGDARGGERPIVAVLPLANLSGDDSIGHLGIGIAHSLTTSLAAIPGVTMISPSADPESRGEKPSAGAVARALGAGLVVTGAIQRSGDLLRITVTLVREDDSVAWGGDVEGNLNDLFSLQRSLASDLARGLRLMLSDQDRLRLDTPPTRSNEALADYTQARSFLERPDVSGNVERAVTLFQGAIEKDPGFALAHAGLGEAYWARYERTKDAAWTELARRATEQAMRLQPDRAAVRYSLAVIYQGTGRDEEAIAELRQVLSLQPNSDDAHRRMGEILEARGRGQDAVEEFRKAIEIRPNYWGNHRELGLAFYRAGRFEDAAAAFRRITELQPDLSWGFQWLGIAYHAAGNLDRAAENYEQAIRLGASPGAYSNLGTIHYRRGRFSRAAEMYEKSLEMRPNSPATLRNLGDTYRRLGREEEARPLYQKAVGLIREQLRVNPNDARTRGMLALYEAKLGRRAEAARLAEEAVAAAPRDGEVLYRKAVVHSLAGETRPALEALRRALAHGYSASEAGADDDLAALRSLAEFRELMKPNP